MSGERYRDGRYAAEHPGWHAENSPWKAARGPGGFSLMVVTEDPEAGVDTGSATEPLA